MERGCFTYHISEGTEYEYKKRHDEIWPEMRAALKEAGFSNYTLFRRGTQIVTYGEFEPNLETVFARLNKMEVLAKWLEWLDGILDVEPGGFEEGELVTFNEVWHIE